MKTRYVLWLKNGSSARADKAWLRSEYPKSICPECARPKKVSSPIDIRLKSITKDPVNYVFGSALYYFRKDFLSHLEPEAEECLVLGRVLDAKDNLIDGFKSVLFKEYILLRGNKRSVCRNCDTCGSLIYSPLGKPYVTSCQEIFKPIVTSQIVPLIVASTVYERLRRTKWKNLGVSELKVVSRPKDGQKSSLFK